MSERPPWPPEMEAIERLAEHDPVLRAAIVAGIRHGLPSLAVLSLAWRETMRAARRSVEDLEHLTRRPSPGTLAMLEYLKRIWRETAIEEAPHTRRRRRFWRRVAEARIGLLYAAARERAALLRMVEHAYALRSVPLRIDAVDLAAARPGEG